MSKLIDSIALPAGLRALSVEQLQQVCRELREELIDVVSASGGHFASSLGATEISVVLHHMLETPRDRIVWDVGHQGYIHKMLTGRRERMRSIRQFEGLSGFLRRDESEYDCFGAGHAGTSISAAAGMRAALDDQRYVVAVIGDGSITAGMAFEALNHAGALDLKRFIVLLNDNEMSISPNVGAMSWLFSRAITSEVSNIARRNIKYLYSKGYMPELVYKAIDRAEEAAQGFFASPAMLFESLGFRYIGPVDGHDVGSLIKAFTHAMAQDGPVLIHAATVKGKGYEPAEEDPIKWHGVVPFDKSKGEFIAAKSAGAAARPAFTSVFSDALLAAAARDPRIVAITAAMAGGTGLDRFQRDYPERFFDVGICEQHAVTFAAGLACEEKRPVVAIYSTFLQRAYDQIVHDVCIQNLPVTFCLDRSGVVGNDGETHQGVFDIAYLRTLPNMVLMSPKDDAELHDMLHTALQHNGPSAIRYPRGTGCGRTAADTPRRLEIGKGELVRSGKDLLIVGFGPLVSAIQTMADSLAEAEHLEAAIINARFAKPLDIELLSAEAPNYPLVISVEDHALQGGFGAALLEAFNDSGISLQSPLKRFGVADSFVAHGSQQDQHRLNGYDMKSIYDFIVRTLSRKLPLKKIAAL